MTLSIPRRPPHLFAALVLLVGATMALGGVKLIALGGSRFFLLEGVALSVSSLLLWRGRRKGVQLYALAFLYAAGWALFETGLDGWGLVCRLGILALLGLWSLTPWVQRGLDGTPMRIIGRLMLIACVLAAIAASASLYITAPRSPDRALATTTSETAASAADADWAYFGGTPSGQRFSSLTQINPGNVAQLKVAWTYRVGRAPLGLAFTLEAAPLEVGGTVYLCTGWNDVIALDAETGRERWRYLSHVNTRGVFIGICRGVSYYKVPAASGECAERILEATIDARLLALDASTGRPCPGFGQQGEVNLLAGMGKVIPGYYFVTSPPTVIHGKVILGGWITDNQSTGEPSGVVRAFDAVTGKFAWAWDLGRPGQHAEPGPGQSYTRGTPNSWAPMSVDEQLGLVYIPTGNATPDYVGAHRSALADRYSSSVVAVDADTGDPRWSFQTTHHDLWDYDVGSQPTLIDLPGPEGVIKALLQPTKRGEVFLLDRLTGKPLARVEERRAPANPAPGEHLAPTQPFSTGMPSFAGPDVSEERMWGLTLIDQLWCRIRFREARYEGTLTPPGLAPVIINPGYNGGIDWGGVSVDPERQLMVVNSSRIGLYVRLLTRAAADRMNLRPIDVGIPGEVSGSIPQMGTPYGAKIEPFLSPLDVPCQQPPYGVLSVVDLKTRRLLWARPLGTAYDSGPWGLESHLPFLLGAPMQGGSVTTRSGLIFIAATQDRFLRGLDLRDGRELWRARLPAGGQANPVTYRSERSARQFVVIAAGGTPGLRTKQGDFIVAYALPMPAGSGDPMSSAP